MKRQRKDNDKKTETQREEWKEWKEGGREGEEREKRGKGERERRKGKKGREEKERKKRRKGLGEQSFPHPTKLRNILLIEEEEVQENWLPIVPYIKCPAKMKEQLEGQK